MQALNLLNGDEKFSVTGSSLDEGFLQLPSQSF